MPFIIVRNDITKMKVDAVVNAANATLQAGGGVCGAIFNAAGHQQVQAECNKIGGCETGKAVITKAYNLDARYIIHAVGPVWQGGIAHEEQLLFGAYTNALKLANQYECQSVAFPLISSGIYGYPKKEAMEVAKGAITGFLQNHDLTVYLVLFDRQATLTGEKLFRDIKEYIDDHYVRGFEVYESTRKKTDMDSEQAFSADVLTESAIRAFEKRKARSLDDLPGLKEESFSQRLFRYIGEKGISDVAAYKGANVNRRHFSKIRTNVDYQPNKSTVIAFAVSLELNIDETQDLLNSAGYTLSRSYESDLIIEYFISQGIYDIFVINEALFDYKQELLGC
jgi:O-acetyl-ADP-ribose deacetylase (regulator of RNase III)